MFFVGGALQALQSAAQGAGGFQGTDWGAKVGTSAMTGTPSVAPGTRGYGWKHMGGGKYVDPGPARPTPQHGAMGTAPMMPFVQGMQGPQVTAGYDESRSYGAKPGSNPRSSRTPMSALARVATRGYTGVAPKGRGGGYR